jgi:hypothetical protein
MEGSMENMIETISKILTERTVLAKEEERLEQHIKSLHRKLIMTVVPKLQEIYKEWRPRIGEKVVELNFHVYPPEMYLMYVREINGTRVETARSMQERSWFSAFMLDYDVGDYERPVFFVPLDIYKKHFVPLELQPFPPDTEF